MKKKLLAIILVAVLAMSLLASCGGSDNNGGNSGSSASVVEEEETLESYIAADQDLQDELEQIATEAGLGIIVEGNTLIFSYSFSEDDLAGFDADTLKVLTDTLGESMASEQDTFIELAKELESETGVSGVTVKVEYLQADGTVLWDGSYTA